MQTQSVIQDVSALWRGFSPQRKTLAGMYFPRPAELALDGRPWTRTFIFPNLNPLQVQEVSLPFQTPFLLHTLTGCIYNVSDGSLNTSSFRLQILHNSGRIQRRLYNKHQRAENVLGTGQNPLFLRTTYMIDQGDVIMIEAKSLVPANGPVTTIQVCLGGCEVDLR
jgi:hypothetical protein